MCCLHFLSSVKMTDEDIPTFTTVRIYKSNLLSQYMYGIFALKPKTSRQGLAPYICWKVRGAISFWTGQMALNVTGLVICCWGITIISAVHATAGRWPPQVVPCTSILSHSHPLTATNLRDVVSSSPFRSPTYSFSFTGCPFWCYFDPPGVAHSGYMSCPLSSHAPHSVVFFTPVLDLITSFQILSLFVMCNNNLSTLCWATASFWCFVSPCLIHM